MKNCGMVNTGRMMGAWQLTGNAREELPGKALYLGARKWRKAIALEEIEYTRAQQVCNDTDMVPKVEAVA